MKKSVKKLLSLILAVVMLATTAIVASAEDNGHFVLTEDGALDFTTAEGEYIYIDFTPETSGYYTFMTSGTAKVYAMLYLLDSDTYLGESVYLEDGKNITMSSYLEADTVYNIVLQCIAGCGAECTLSVASMEDMSIFDAIGLSGAVEDVIFIDYLPYERDVILEYPEGLACAETPVFTVNDTELLNITGTSSAGFDFVTYGIGTVELTVSFPVADFEKTFTACIEEPLAWKGSGVYTVVSNVFRPDRLISFSVEESGTYTIYTEEYEVDPWI